MTTSPLWTGDEVLRATGGDGPADWRASGVSIDSRSIRPGELFVPLEGPNFDGHDFIDAAFEKGAAAAVAARASAVSRADRPLVRVDDTLAALGCLGAARRAESGARIVAITGSVGKTGTKEALRHALAQQAPTHASHSSYNNHWGVPLSLARMPRDIAYGIFELGMNNPGEIARLTTMVRPHLALITAIAPAHLAVFDSVAEIARAKAEIFQGLEPGGVAILCRDTPYFDVLRDAAASAGAAKIVSFGESVEADVRLSRLAEHPACVCVAADVGAQAVTFKVGAPGRHWAINGLAVLAAVAALDADLGRAALALATFAPLKGRGRRHEVAYRGGCLQVIDESYNANPASVRAALAVLAQAAPAARGRRLAVLGDMLELGRDAEALHRELADDLVAADVDLVFACGKHMRALLADLPRPMRGAGAATSAELLPRVLEAVAPGDVVTVKGSLGMAMAPIVEALLALDGNGAPMAAAG